MMRNTDSTSSLSGGAPISETSKVKYVNRYRPPVPAGELHLETPLDEYDLNFGPAHEVPRLTGSFVELRPLIPSIHGQLAYDYCHDIDNHEEITGSKPGTFDKLEGWLGLVEVVRSQPRSAMWAIFVDPAVYNPIPDKLPRWIDDSTATSGTETWRYAGSLALDVSSANLTASLGIGIVRQCAGRGIGSQAGALLIDWCMRLPRDGGLGMRRFGWGAGAWNKASQATAFGLGLKYAGLMRNTAVSYYNRDGEKGREGDTLWPKQSRHSWESDGTSDDWELNGWKEHIRGFIHGRPRSQAGRGESDTTPSA